MDTIAYLPNPSEPTEMLHIVVNHPKFTNTKVRETMAIQMKKYDKYDLSNDASARDYLLDSLEKTFCRDVEDKSRDAKSFPELFMIIVRIITDDSIEHWEIIKREMRALVPHKYPGHDITLMTKECAQPDSMITASWLASPRISTWPETPKFAILLLNQRVQDAVDSIRFLDQSAADSYMATHKLLYTHVIEELNSKYLISLKQGEWPAKSSHHDSKAVPTSFGAHKHPSL